MRLGVEYQERVFAVALEATKDITVAEIKQRVIAFIRKARALTETATHDGSIALNSMCLQYESEKNGRITLNASKFVGSYNIPEGSILTTTFSTLPAAAPTLQSDTAIRFLMSSPRSLSNVVPARIAPTDTTTPVKRPYSDARSVSQSPTHDHGESGHHTRRTNYGSRSWSDHDTFASKYEIVGDMESPEWAMKIKFKSPLPHYVKGGVEFGFFCRICRKHYTGTGQECPWITIPCINHNKQAFVRHEGSDIHRDNCQNDHRADNLDTMIRHAAAPNFLNLRKQLRTCEYIVKNKIPVSQYEELIQLQIANGAFPSKVGLFESRKAAREMVECLATAARGVLKKNWQQAKCIGVTLDETTDISVKSQLIVFYKYVLKGVVHEDEAGLEQLHAGNAHTVTAAILARLRKDDIPVSKVVFIGSDGASVMLGCKNGVQKRFRLLNPEMCGMHCVLHRFSLVASSAASGCSSMEHFFDNVEGLARHYRFSASRCSQLSQVQLSMDQPASKLIEACFTRWGTHDPLTQCLLANLHAVMQQLRADIESPEAQGYHSFLNNEDTIFYLRVVRDVLPVLNHFSKVLQANDIDFELLEDELDIVEQKLQGFIENPGHHVQSYNEVLRDVTQHCTDAGIRPPRQGHRGRMETTRVHFLLALQANMKSRFPSIEILKTFQRVLQPSKCRTTDPVPAAELEILKHHYRHHQLIPDAESGVEYLEADWLSYARFCARKKGSLVQRISYVYDTGSEDWCPAKGHTPMKQITEMAEMGTSDMCKSFLQNETLVEANAGLARLMEIYLTFPLTTVNCERGFSCTKLTKTALRSKTASDLLDMLVFLSNFPDIKAGLPLPDCLLDTACNLFVESRSLQYGCLTQEARAECDCLAYTWGASITPQDTADEQQRWLACEGANIDLHGWTGSASSVDCRAAAIRIVGARSALVSEAVAAPDVSAAAARTPAAAAKQTSTPAPARRTAVVAAAAAPASDANVDYMQPDGEAIFEVEEIMDVSVRGRKPQLFYKVWWKGYEKPRPGCNESWEPQANLSTSLVRQWNQGHAAAYNAAIQDIETRKTKPKNTEVDTTLAINTDAAAVSRIGRLLTPNPRFLSR